MTRPIVGRLLSVLSLATVASALAGVSATAAFADPTEYVGTGVAASIFVARSDATSNALASAKQDDRFCYFGSGFQETSSAGGVYTVVKHFTSCDTGAAATSDGLCLDRPDTVGPVVVQSCSTQRSQGFARNDNLRVLSIDGYCLDAGPKDEQRLGRTPVVTTCSSGSAVGAEQQAWTPDLRTKDGLCLSANGVALGDSPYLAVCDAADPAQQWTVPEGDTLIAG